MIVTQREREAETQAEGEAASMHREPDVGFDPRSPGSRPGPCLLYTSDAADELIGV